MTSSPHFDTKGREQDRHGEIDPGDSQQSQQPTHFAPQASASDQDESFAMLGMLVGELHGDAASERLSHDGGALDLEYCQQVAQPAGLRAQGVVARRLGRLPVAGQVRGDDRMITSEQRKDLLPGARAPGDPVDEQDGRAVSGSAVGHVMSVDRNVLEERVRASGCAVTISTGYPHTLKVPLSLRRRKSQWTPFPEDLRGHERSTRTPILDADRPDAQNDPNNGVGVDRPTSPAPTPRGIPPRDACDGVAGYGHEMTPDQTSDDEVRDATAAAEQAMHPQSVPVNAYEAPGALVVIAPFPAVTPDDVTVEARPGVLRIVARSAERRARGST